jgi:hypothetical protein
MTKTEKRGVRGSGKVAFWARKESIKKMLDDKYSLMATFLAHEKDVGISYGQFRIYVNEYIKGEVKNEIKPEQTKGTIRKPIEPNDDRPRFKPSGKRDDLV